MLLIKRVVFASLLLTFFNCNTNSAESQAATKQPLEDKYAGWLPIKLPGLLKSIEGDYKVNRYWELFGGGVKPGQYFVIRTSEELDAFWNNELKEVRIKGEVLEKPDINFDKSLLIMTMPGDCHGAIGYKIIVWESGDSIKLNMSNFVIGKPHSLLSIRPIFCFEIPVPPKSKPITVDFDVECQRIFQK